MLKDPGSSRRTATPIVDLTASPFRVLKNKIGGRDRFDLYRFTLTGSNNYRFSFTLNQLKADADIELLNSRGAVLRASRKKGKAPDSFVATLSPGTYYVQVRGNKETTNYRLALSGSVITPQPPVIVPPTNTAPILGGTRSISAQRGGLTPTNTVITNAALNTTDGQQSASSLTYRVASLPQQGALFRNGAQLAVNSTFTQADVNSGTITYQQQAIKTLPNSTGTNQAVMSGTNAAWISGSGSSEDVYFYNGTTGQTTKVSSFSADYSYLQISGSTVVWTQYYSFGDESDIWYSINGATPSKIDSSSFNDYSPVVSGSNIAFIRNDKSGTNVQNDGVYLFNTSTGTSTQLESSTDNVYEIAISGSNVAWARYFPGGDEYDIRYSVNGGSATSINSSTSLSDYKVQISGSTIAFVRDDKSGVDVATDGLYTYNITTGTLNQLESSTDSIYSIAMSGSTIAWARYYSGNNEYDVRYSINGSSPTAISTSTTYSDYSPLVSGNNIAFYRDDAGTANDGTYLYNTTTGSVIRITGNSPSGINGRDVLYKNGSGESANVRRYNGNVASDSFGFTVSDGAFSIPGVLNITIV